MNANFDGHCMLQKITGCDGIKKGEPIVNQDKNYNSHESCWDKVDQKLNTVFEDAVASGVLTRANVEDYMYMYTDEVKGDAFKNKWTKEYVFNKPSKEVDIQSLVEAVKSHAYRHYNEEGGWDFVIETMEDEDIAGLLTATGEWEHEETPVATLEEALERVEEIVSLWDEQRYNYLV